MRRTIAAALDEAHGAIGRLDARVLACHAFGVGRAWLAANPMHVPTEAQDALFDSLVSRRAMGYPVAYLVGTREFFGRDFEVGPAVLIPRPETETLVEAALERVSAGTRVLDLGAGSGAIAVTIACERDGATVVAVDSCAQSLEVARANALRHGARIEFALGNWYEPVADRRFGLIVANPPYVAAGDHHLLEGDLRYEPRGALTDGSADGLDSIRAIVAGAAAHLEPGGWLLTEHGYDQALPCRALLESAGFKDLVSLPDIAGIPRVAGGRRQ